MPLPSSLNTCPFSLSAQSSVRPSGCMCASMDRRLRCWGGACACVRRTGGHGSHGRRALQGQPCRRVRVQAAGPHTHTPTPGRGLVAKVEVVHQVGQVHVEVIKGVAGGARHKVKRARHLLHQHKACGGEAGRGGVGRDGHGQGPGLGGGGATGPAACQRRHALQGRPRTHV